jgi:ABC-type Fe3+/spermidine/putrescine transport system ATPase subunit
MRADAVMAALGWDRMALPRLGEATHGQGFAALAAARLIPKGGVLLVDEAGTGLTEGEQEVWLDWLRAEAATGRTIVLATRCRGVAMAADHLVLLRGGHLVQAGAPASVYAEPRDAEAARLTGPANLLRGTVRQKLPGGFVWMQAGQRFTQADPAGQAGPVLGSEVSLCLRPDHIAIMAAEGAQNRVSGVVTRLICRGGQTEIGCETPLGTLRLLVAGPPGIRAGMTLPLGWSAEAAAILPAG